MEWWQITITGLGAIITVFTVWEKIESRINKTKAPREELESRVEKLERIIDVEYKELFISYEERFKRDLERLNELERTNKLMMKALLELTRHAETGNNTAKLKQVADEIQDYILNK